MVPHLRLHLSEHVSPVTAVAVRGMNGVYSDLSIGWDLNGDEFRVFVNAGNGFRWTSGGTTIPGDALEITLASTSATKPSPSGAQLDGDFSPPSRELVEAACESSCDAWLTFFPSRSIFLAQHRDMVGDFAQTLEDVVQAVRRSPDASDEIVRHYADNMELRVRLLQSVLQGEAAVGRQLDKERQALSQRSR